MATRLHDRGARIVQLTVRRFTEPVRVHGLELVDRVYPLPLQASFRCDQPFLNRLWDKACATVAACSTDLFIDCPWREQTFWLDDYYEEHLFYLCLTAERTFPERNLRVSAEAAFPNGQFSGRYPSARDSVLPVTSANWIMVLADYYRFSGDLALVRELLPAADAVLELFDSWRDSDLLVPDRPGQWNFIDWGYDTAGIRLGGKTAVLNLLVAAAGKEAALLHAAAGDAARARHLEERSRATVAALVGALWAAAAAAPAGLHRAGRRPAHVQPDPPRPGAVLRSAPGGAARGGAGGADRSGGGAVGAGLPVLRAGFTGGCGPRRRTRLQVLRELWGGMVEADTPTLWEVVDGALIDERLRQPVPRLRLARPLPVLQRAVLGVAPLAPGFTEFRFAPQGTGSALGRGPGADPARTGGGCPGRSRSRTRRWRPTIVVPEGTTALCPDGRRLAPGAPRTADRAGGVGTVTLLRQSP